MRVGMGYDVHRLAEDRKMILGGAHLHPLRRCARGSRSGISIKEIRLRIRNKLKFLLN